LPIVVKRQFKLSLINIRLISQFPLARLESAEDLTMAYAAIEPLVDRLENLGNDEAAYLDTLSMLIEQYEIDNKLYELESILPGEALKYLMEYSFRMVLSSLQFRHKLPTLQG